MVTIPLPPFEPDKSRYNVAATPNLLNVVPTADGWGPLKGPVVNSTYFAVLTDQDGVILTDQDDNVLIVGRGGAGVDGAASITGDVKGMIAARKADGTEAIFVGTEDAIYTLDMDTFLWEEFSGDSAPYSTNARWSCVKFGSYVYFANGVDPEQMIDIENDTEFSDNDSAPIAKYIAAWGDFVVRANIDGHPSRVQWSAINNPQANTAGEDLSGFQDMPEGDECMGVVPLSGGYHVIMRTAVQAMSFTGENEYVFRRTLVDGKRGTSAPYSICVIGQDDYFVYFDEGFFRFQGGAFKNIGEGRVNRWFLSDCDQSERVNILAALDPEHSIVWVGYTDTDGNRKSLGYQYNYDRFCLAELAFDASTTARTFINSESPVPFVEADLWRFAMIDEIGRLSYLDGDNLAAVLETNDVEFAPDRTFVNRIRLNSDASDFEVTVSTANTKGGPYRSRPPASPSARSGAVGVRADGKVHKFRIDVPAAHEWTTATGLEVEAQRSGRQ